jgi:hypothetical protein
MPVPRVAKAQPWAGIGERFQRYSFPMSPLKNGYHFDFLCKGTSGSSGEILFEASMTIVPDSSGWPESVT